MRSTILNINRSMPWMLTLVTVFALFVGWRLSAYRLIHAESGMGYWFGITGGSLMLSLLIYPLRKRNRSWGAIGSVKLWFRLHMLLGVFGPLFIMYHSNFHLGSLNSNVALFCMLIVAFSGVFGRYFYSKIHKGLYGRKENLNSLKAELESEKEHLELLFRNVPALRDRLMAFAQDVSAPATRLGGSILRIFTTGHRVRVLRREVKKAARTVFKTHAKTHHWTSDREEKMILQFKREAYKFLTQAVRVSEFSLYERLFALWHVLHIPLFFIMVTAIVVHIIAVHLY